METSELLRGEPFGREVVAVVIAHIMRSGHEELEFLDEFPVTVEPGQVLRMSAEVSATDGSNLILDACVQEAGAAAAISVKVKLKTSDVSEIWLGLLQQVADGTIIVLMLDRENPPFTVKIH